MEIVKEMNTTAKVKDNNLKPGNKVMLNNSAACKYETPYTGPFLIIQCFTNVIVKLKMAQQKIRIIYIALSHTNLILKLKILVQKVCLTMSTYNFQLYTSV